MAESGTKKKKGMLQKIGSKFKDDKPDDLVLDTIGELKSIVGSMKDVFQQFEGGYEAQLEEERSTMDKVQSKLPKFMQKKEMQVEEARMKRIKANRSNLGMLEENLEKLTIILASSNSTAEMLGKGVVDAAYPEGASEEKIQELENKIAEVQDNLSESMNQIASQMSLIKSALDNMAGQLDEHGVVLEGIDGKIDVIDTKMDKAQEMLKKISTKISQNRWLMIGLVALSTGLILSKLLKP